MSDALIVDTGAAHVGDVALLSAPARQAQALAAHPRAVGDASQTRY
ncbi:hypothetical protein [Catenuloplanes japonicus]|nr:hypothetical protein [Catenuloplanes japonicus]